MKIWGILPLVLVFANDALAFSAIPGRNDTELGVSAEKVSAEKIWSMSAEKMPFKINCMDLGVGYSMKQLDSPCANTIFQSIYDCNDARQLQQVEDPAEPNNVPLSPSSPSSPPPSLPSPSLPPPSLPPSLPPPSLPPPPEKKACIRKTDFGEGAKLKFTKVASEYDYESLVHTFARITGGGWAQGLAGGMEMMHKSKMNRQSVSLVIYNFKKTGTRRIENLGNLKLTEEAKQRMTVGSRKNVKDLFDGIQASPLFVSGVDIGASFVGHFTFYSEDATVDVKAKVGFSFDANVFTNPDPNNKAGLELARLLSDRELFHEAEITCTGSRECSVPLDGKPADVGEAYDRWRADVSEMGASNGLAVRLAKVTEVADVINAITPYDDNESSWLAESVPRGSFIQRWANSQVMADKLVKQAHLSQKFLEGLPRTCFEGALTGCTADLSLNHSRSVAKCCDPTSCCVASARKCALEKMNARYTEASMVLADYEVSSNWREQQQKYVKNQDLAFLNKWKPVELKYDDTKHDIDTKNLKNLKTCRNDDKIKSGDYYIQLADDNLGPGFHYLVAEEICGLWSIGSSGNLEAHAQRKSTWWNVAEYPGDQNYPFPYYVITLRGGTDSSCWLGYYLSTSSAGEVDFAEQVSWPGRQRWRFEYAGPTSTGQNSYYIRLAGVPLNKGPRNRLYMSARSGNQVRMRNAPNLEGSCNNVYNCWNQRWVLTEK
mmetsp:Transcript_47871/g.79229  ORF Transcript_47871/g.79229 Transcript_47871/m.79229 type:complete len:717 (-) Transcript_47871:415-2565(-)